MCERYGIDAEDADHPSTRAQRQLTPTLLPYTALMVAQSWRLSDLRPFERSGEVLEPKLARLQLNQKETQDALRSP